MKLDIRLHRGSEIRECRLELRPVAENGSGSGQLRFLLENEAVEVDWAEITPGIYSILLEGRSYEAKVTRQTGATRGATPCIVTVGTRQYFVEVRDPRVRRHAGVSEASGAPQEIVAPMPGKIAKVLVAENQEIRSGEGLLVIEAMKMQNELRAPRSGRVEKIYVEEGIGVETGSKLLRLV